MEMEVMAIRSEEEILGVGLMKLEVDDVVAIRHVPGKPEVMLYRELTRLNVPEMVGIAAIYEAGIWGSAQPLDDEADATAHRLLRDALDEYVKGLLARF